MSESDSKKDAPVDLISKKPIEQVPDGVHTSNDIESNIKKAKSQSQVPPVVGSSRG